MNSFIQLVQRVSQACGVIAAGLLAAATLVVCEMVVMRYFLGASTIWQTEFVTYAIVGATFIGAPYVLLHKGHVSVDLAALYVRRRPLRFALAVIGIVLSFTFCATVAWAGWRHWHEAWAGGWRTETVWALPLWIPLLAMPIGMGLVALQYVADFLCLLTGREIPFGVDPEDEE
ncbi:MAG: C4-dicarboxylate ABC transporter substrate-binding protein [Acidithiobacillales bacterium SM23_46]|nr:MAG: C4-dicarboxylate ABC transporter substrate-binding protein [Thiotrichales bacterium SG8_50]KPK67447.1 MAG: C4-dicarboxylate ABC transporter substrate-binding protein [Acidithiobacillales bacterium SM23_46]KPL26992.1 MAG: C4-dicarboxylate ABC transporter substrate-binding protein [Acidithiobacillales bacterium SM1_46]